MAPPGKVRRGHWHWRNGTAMRHMVMRVCPPTPAPRTWAAVSMIKGCLWMQAFGLQIELASLGESADSKLPWNSLQENYPYVFFLLLTWALFLLRQVCFLSAVGMYPFSICKRVHLIAPPVPKTYCPRVEPLSLPCLWDLPHPRAMPQSHTEMLPTCLVERCRAIPMLGLPFHFRQTLCLFSIWKCHFNWRKHFVEHLPYSKLLLCVFPILLPCP